MRNGETTSETPFRAHTKPDDNYSYVTAEIQSPPLGAVVSPDCGARFLFGQTARMELHTQWLELPRRKVELVAIVDGVELRSGACRTRGEALARLKKARAAVRAAALEGAGK